MKTPPHYSKAIHSILLAILPVAASAQLLISDNFNTNSTGINDDLGARQSGSLSTVSWVSGFDPSTTTSSSIGISGNQLYLQGGSNVEANAALNLDFATVDSLLANGAFQVSFNVDPTEEGSYAAFTIGSVAGLESNTRPLINSSSDFALLMRNDGTGNVFSASSNTGAFSGANWDSGLAVITVETADFTSGTAYTITMSVNGSDIDLNGAATGNAFIGTWDTDGTNYMYLSGRAGGNLFDNYSISAIPEPSAFALTSTIFGLVVLMRRRIVSR